MALVLFAEGRATAIAGGMRGWRAATLAIPMPLTAEVAQGAGIRGQDLDPVAGVVDR